MSLRFWNQPRRISLRTPLFRTLAESLEERLLLTYDPTSTEQLFLYDTNRVRVDPQGELSYLFTSTSPLTSPDSNVNAAMSYFHVDTATFLSQWSALVATAPLAWNDNLYNAAVGHNAAMIAADTQSHQVAGEKSLAGRLTDAGYNYSTAGENVYAYTYSEFYGHSGFLIDWGNATPGHRDNIMNSAYKEVGISVTPENNSATAVGPLVVTQDFGVRFGDTNPASSVSYITTGIPMDVMTPAKDSEM
ncbi:MAG: CAP domain-containing protein [Planctomycetales bacterium]